MELNVIWWGRNRAPDMRNLPKQDIRIIYDFCEWLLSNSEWPETLEEYVVGASEQAEELLGL